MKKKESQSGFTLVEILVTVAIVSVVSVAFASYLYQQNKSINSTQSKQDLSTLQGNVLNCTSSTNCLQQSENMKK